MFVIEGKAELKEIKLKMDPNGDQFRRTLVLKLLAQGIAADRLDSAISEIDKYWNKEQPALQETYPIRVSHKIENVAAVLSEIDRPGPKSKAWELGAVDVDKMQITPKMDNLCDILMELHTADISVAKGLLDVLHGWLKGEIIISLVERQLSLPEMEMADG
jgi:hypothetical protein